MSAFTPLLIDRQPDVIDPLFDDFIARLPLGQRPYHTNRFRIYFRVPAGHRLRGRFGADLWQRFSDVFNQSAAVVAVDRRTHNGAPVLRFTGDMPGPDVHNDYVYRLRLDEASSFTVQTVKRHFEDDKDSRLRSLLLVAITVLQQLGPSAFAALPIIGNVPLFRWLAEASMRDLVTLRIVGGTGLVHTRLANFAVAASQRHFLAGRRGWKIAPASSLNGDGSAPEGADVFFLETSAIERVTRKEFLPGRGFFNDQTKIIWSTMLRNYVADSGFEKVDHRAFSGGTHEKSVSFVEADYDRRGACVTGAAEIIGMFPDLLPAAH